MDIFVVLSLIGGLALFLYGMHVMGDGLTNLSGGKLEQVLAKLTSNRLKAVILGLGVTAVIQSSSATTVMVVGFVNSGIMKLTQAVGVIMGANIGTTITAWILSLTGIQSDNVLVRMFKPSSFSPVFAAIGMILLFSAKSDKKKQLGNILLGFSVLMFGMEMMSDAVSPLKDVPGFTSILTMFSNPVLGVIAGAALTAVIQSSSASIGILQALCATGSVSYSTAIPVIMGQNIGTCITAILSSIGASKNAKRASSIHLYFNLIGTVLFISLFYSINFLSPFAFLDDSANQMGIAVIHTTFNVFTTLVLFPFSSYLVKLSEFTIKDGNKEGSEEKTSDMPEALKALDTRFLELPGFAVTQCKKAVIEMAQITNQALDKAIGLLWNYDKKIYKEVEDKEKLVDQYEDIVGSYLVKLSTKHLMDEDSKCLSFLLHSINDLERISDHAVSIAKSAKEITEKGEDFSSKALGELEVLSQAVMQICNNTVEILEKEDNEIAQSIQPLNEVIELLQVEIKERHIKRLRKGKCTIKKGFILTDIITSFQRVAAHCSNIALSMIQINQESLETHGYAASIPKGEGSTYNKEFIKFKNKYVLSE
ncbi:MAG TPA: Na/Pi cotransporter family protein [Acetivibrio sp.]|nr:Na/Pi cotransporter family protein [Acetivibrio sp.]